MKFSNYSDWNRTVKFAQVKVLYNATLLLHAPNQGTLTCLINNTHKSSAKTVPLLKYNYPRLSSCFISLFQSMVTIQGSYFGLINDYSQKWVEERWPECEANHSPTHNAKVKNWWCYMLRSTNLLNCIWNKEELPTQWDESVTVHLCKRGDKMTSNYRGISLLPTKYS